MKYLSVIIAMLLGFCTNSFAQKSKMISISEMKPELLIKVGGTVTYKADMTTPKDTLFYVGGQDARYEQISTSLTLATGTLSDIRALLAYSQNILQSEEVGVYVIYKENTIWVTKNAEMKICVALSPIGGTDNGYCYVTDDGFTYMISAIDEWAKANKVNVNK